MQLRTKALSETQQIKQTGQEVFILPSDIMLMIISKLSVKEVVALSAADKYLNKLLMSSGSKVSQLYWRRQCLSNSSFFNCARSEATNWLERFKNIPAILNISKDISKIFTMELDPERALDVAIRIAAMGGYKMEYAQELENAALKLIALGVNIKVSAGQPSAKLPFYIAMLGNVTIMKALLEQGFDVNYVNSYEELLDVGLLPLLVKNTALAAAVVYNKADIVKLLLENGADPTIKGEHGYDVYRFIQEFGDHIDSGMIDLMKDKLIQMQSCSYSRK